MAEVTLSLDTVIHCLTLKEIVLFDSYLKGVGSKSYNLDTSLSTTNTETLSLDTYLYKPFTIQMDTVLKGTETTFYSLDTTLGTQIEDRTVLFEYGSQSVLHNFKPAPTSIEIDKGKRVVEIEALKENDNYYNTLGDRLETISLKGVIVNQRLYNLGSKTDKEQIDALKDIITGQDPVEFYDKNYGQCTVFLNKLDLKREKGVDGYKYDIELLKVEA